MYYDQQSYASANTKMALEALCFWAVRVCITKVCEQDLLWTTWEKFTKFGDKDEL